jgi:Ca-activated chloride channel homolog
VTFGHPYLLLTLLVIPAGLLLYRLAMRRRMRYAIRYTNVDVLASVVAAGRPWRRWIATAAFLLAVGTLCAAVARPHVHRLVASDNATVVLVLDVSGSMQAEDVKPTRLGAAQRALHVFLDKVPSRLKVGLVLFAGEAEVATPPTTDHALVAQSVDDADLFRGFGGTAIGDAIAAAVQVGLRSAGIPAGSATAAPQSRSLASFRTSARRPASTLVSILFLSDGHQTRGTLAPLQGAARARAAGIPVYTVALGTTGNTTLRGMPGFPGGAVPVPAGGFNFGRRGLAPDPKTLQAIADVTGGKFYRARSAGAVKETYSALGSKLGRKRGTTEVTDAFLGGAAILLLLAGGLSALWSPRLPYSSRLTPARAVCT